MKPTITYEITSCCINTRSVANKAASICQAIVDSYLDVIVIMETWHECSESVSLKRVTPAGFQLIDAARPLITDVNIQSDRLMNHGRLALIYHDGVKIIKNSLVQP